MISVADTRVWQEDRRGVDRVLEWLLIGLLAFMPFAFGVVEAWSEEIVVVVTLVISLCFCVRAMAFRHTPMTWTWAYVPLVAFLGVAALQLVPLATPFLRLVSPNTVGQKMRLLTDLYGAEVTPRALEISFYRHATRHDLRLVLATAAIFVIVLNLFRRPEQIRRLLLAIAGVGAGIALVALAQDVVGNSRIYGCVSSPHGTAFSGPFVNHSHYAQFMNLSIGAALALVFVRVHEHLGGRKLTPALIAEYLGSPEARVLWALGAMIVAGAATIFVSLSRGGMISMMIAGTFTALVISWKKSLRGPGWVMALLALGAFVCVLYIGFDAVYDRLGTLTNLTWSDGSRWQIVKDVAIAWTRFPLLGTGLGTHEVVYPMFDRATVGALASHAENEYAQAAEETGAVGLLALVAFGVLVWSSYARAIRSARLPIHSAAYGLGFGLVAILVHSLSDFGQHLPANAFLTAVFCALLIRLPRVGAWDEAAAEETVMADIRGRLPGAVALILVGAVGSWAAVGADAARRGERHWATALAAERDLARQNWLGSDEEYTHILRAAVRARDGQPGNIKYRHWLNIYRWRAISRAVDPNSGAVLLVPQEVAFAGRIAEELRQALSACLVYGPAWSVLGQMEKFVLGCDEEGVRHIRRGRMLAPCDATTCLVAGMLYAEQGETDRAFDEWQRAVKLDNRLLEDALSLCVSMADRPNLARRLAEGDADRLARLEVMLRNTQADHQLLQQVREDLQVLLERECQGPGVSAWQFAWLSEKYVEDNRAAEAIQMYRQALALQYGQVLWRYRLAELLVQQGAVPEAVRELQTCLRLQPHFPEARGLLAKLPAP
jgi:tetratricopeptide (TPR) repeat protein